VDNYCFKIIYSGKTSTCNGVGVIIDMGMKSKVVYVIVVELIFEENPLYIVSAYAPQVVFEEKAKEVFW